MFWDNCFWKDVCLTHFSTSESKTHTLSAPVIQENVAKIDIICRQEWLDKQSRENRPEGNWSYWILYLVPKGQGHVCGGGGGGGRGFELSWICARRVLPGKILQREFLLWEAIPSVEAEDSFPLSRYLLSAGYFVTVKLPISQFRCRNIYFFRGMLNWANFSINQRFYRLTFKFWTLRRVCSEAVLVHQKNLQITNVDTLAELKILKIPHIYYWIIWCM